MQAERDEHGRTALDSGQDARDEGQEQDQNRVAEGRGHTIMVPSERTEYEVVKPIVETASARYYLCRTREGDWRILSIAATVADNVAMERVADVLQFLEQESAAREAEYQKHNEARVKFWDFRDSIVRRARELRGDERDLKKAPPSLEELQEVERQREAMLNKRLHYDWLFPILQEQFIANTQGKRMTNVLEFIGADISDLMPLEQVVKRNQRVDLKTSAWIIGRMLKLLGFLASTHIQVSMSMSKFLLGPEHHHVMLLDWSNAMEYYGDNPESVNLNISRIGDCGLKLIGARFDDGGWEYPYEYGEKAELEKAYVEFLYDMALLKRQFYRTYDQAYYVHQMFYQVVDDAWGKAYHPFTIYPI